MSDWNQIRRRFEQAGQGHVLTHWDDLDADARSTFQAQLEDVDLDLIVRLAGELLETGQAAVPKLEPAPVIREPRPDEAADWGMMRSEGEETIRQGKVATFVVAGGQGTRLGYDGPKGCFDITPVHGKSLFQWHAEKIVAIRERYGVSIPWIVMTSHANDEATRAYFDQQDGFGLPAEDLIFIQQAMMPAVDAAGKLLLAGRDRLFLSPNGHGGSLLALRTSGALDQLRERGIEEIFYFQVDNPLLRMLDPAFIALHRRETAEMSSKVVAKRSPDEKVGVVGLIDGQHGVIEYSDLTPEQMQERDAQGRLRYNAGNIAIHLIRRDFIERLTEGGTFELPYHRAHKKIPHLDDSGRLVEPSEPNGYKFETFVFDALRLARHSVTLEVPRELEFAPVKNALGEDSPESSRDALTELFRSWVESSELDLDVSKASAVEIAPAVALDRDDFIRRVAAGEVEPTDVSTS